MNEKRAQTSVSPTRNPLSQSLTAKGYDSSFEVEPEPEPGFQTLALTETEPDSLPLGLWLFWPWPASLFLSLLGHFGI